MKRGFRRGRHGRRLRKRIWLHLLVVLLVGVFASSFVFFTGWRSAFMRSAATRLARHSAMQVAKDYGNPEARRRTVRRIAEDLDVDVTLRAMDGTVVESAGAVFPPLDASRLYDLRHGELVIERGPRFFVAVPVIVDGEVRAVLESAPTGRPYHLVLLWRPLLTLGVLVLIAGVASGPLARRISLPIERLTDAVRRFGAGDLSARVGWQKLSPRWRHHHGPHRGRGPDELEQLTRAFDEMAERIERLVRGQKELLANVSHELRSPLARMRVALELLPRDPAAQARFRDIEIDLEELDRLIEDVLTTSRLEASGLPVHLGNVDVRGLLEQIAARAANDPTTAGKSVEVAAGAGVTVLADAGLLKRALWNLVENAAKYGAPPIGLDARVDGGELVLRVSDHGPGVPEDERERIFDPFYRSDKARTPGAGFGLGLTLVRRIAEVHGGSVAVAPNGAGSPSGFVIRLPLKS